MAIGHNAALLLANRADAGSVSASSSLAEAPASRVLADPVARQWSSETGTAWLLIDHGAEVPIDTLWAGNLHASTRRFRLSNNAEDATLDTLFDSGVLVVDQNHRSALSLLEEPVSARFWLIDLVHASDAYVLAGRVASGARSTWQVNMEWGFPRRYDRQNIVHETLGRQQIVYPRPRVRIMEPTFSFMQEATRDGFVEQLLRDIGTDVPFLFMADPASAAPERDTMWCRMTDDPTLAHVGYDNWSTTLNLRETL